MNKLLFLAASSLAFLTTINTSASSIENNKQNAAKSYVINIPDQATPSRLVASIDDDYFTENEALKISEFDENLDNVNEYPVEN